MGTRVEALPGAVPQLRSRISHVGDGPGVPVQRARLRQQDLEADLLQHPQRGIVDGGDPVFGKQRLRMNGLRSVR
jgi:hypothetical protein